MRVVGLDPAFANFGMVAGSAELANGAWRFEPDAMQLLQTKGDGKKREVRKSSEILRRGQELHRGLHQFLSDNPPELVFVEVPSGAQNANAAQGLSVAVGVLASIRAPLIEVAPIEIKRLFTPRNVAVPKKQIMDWAYTYWPDAAWLMHGGRRVLDNEHLADACAAVVAGLHTQTFLQLQALRSHEVPMPDHNGSALGGSPARRVPLGAVPMVKQADPRTRRAILKDPW